MPTSEKQLAANRKNAQKSTGPRTTAGKAKSARNAVTHGLYAESAVIDSPYLKESPEEYDQLHQGLIDELNPHGSFELQLVATITNCLWRQNRAMNAETAHINRELQHQSDLPIYRASDDETDDTEQLTQRRLRAAASSIPRGNFSAELLRYEMRLDIRLTRALKTLNHLQSLRRQAQERADAKDRELARARRKEFKARVKQNELKIANSKGRVRRKESEIQKQLGNEPIFPSTESVGRVPEGAICPEKPDKTPPNRVSSI